MPAARRHTPFLVLFAVAVAVRLWGLSWLPSPAGDEGRWSLFGIRILYGQPVSLGPRGGFVSTLYAHLIAASMDVLGPTVLAARTVNAVASLAAIAGGYALLSWMESRRAGLTLAALLALHPWSVAYSRIGSVPYALALAVLTLGGLSFLAGLRARRGGLVGAGILISALGAHFSPLTVVGPVACVAFAAAPEHRWVFRHWMSWAAVAVSQLHALPVVYGAIGAAARSPELEPLSDFGAKLASHLHMISTGLAGEATLRHFTNLALSPTLALVVVPPVLILIALAGTRRVREARPLGSFGLVHLGVGLLVTPLVLAPGREWDLPFTHTDRYLFSVLPGFFMCVAGVASLPHRLGSVTAIAFLVWLAGAGDGRLAWSYLASHGVDRGELVFEGGSGYRGWLVTDRPAASTHRIRDVALRELGPGGGALLVADRTFMALPVAMRGTRIPVHDVRGKPIPPHPRGRYLALTWPDAVLSLGDPPTAPARYVAANRRLRERVQSKFRRAQLVELLRQRDGAPLLEIWLAELPVPPRLRPAGETGETSPGAD